MISSNIGYIICESDVQASQTNIIPQTLNGKSIAECILQDADEKNRNGRYYSKEELFPQLTAPRTVELLNAGALRAECGHPLSKDLQRQATIDDTKTCARFLKLWTDGNHVMAHAVATNNELGRAFDLDLKEGCKPAWSLRALGSIEQTRRGAEVRNLRLITWDNVIYPSHPGAYTQRVISESALTDTDKKTHLQQLVSESVITGNDDYISKTNAVINTNGYLYPMYDDDVIKFVQQESSNLKFVRECFDFVYSGIQLDEKCGRVLLTTDEGDTLAINLENYIFNELMEYGYNRLSNTEGTKEETEAADRFYFEKFELGKKEEKEEDEWDDDSDSGIISDEDFDKYCAGPVKEIVSKYESAARKAVADTNSSRFASVYSSSSKFALNEVQEDGVFDLISYDIDDFKSANKDKFDKKSTDEEVGKELVKAVKEITTKINSSVSGIPNGVSFIGFRNEDNWDSCDGVIKFSGRYLKGLVKKGNKE